MVSGLGFQEYGEWVRVQGWDFRGAVQGLKGSDSGLEGQGGGVCGEEWGDAS